MTEETITLNPYRLNMIREVIEKHPGIEITVEALAPHLPDDFDLSAEHDLVLFQNDGAQADAEPAEQPEPDEQTEQSEPELPMVAATPDDIDAAYARKAAADQALANRRAELVALQRKEVDARTRLSSAVASFQRGFAVVTPEQLHRDFLASEAALRAARKAGLAPPRHSGRGIGPSAIDRSAYFQRFGHGAAAGGGRAYAGRAVTGVDGSFIKPSASQTRLMPFARPRLPSER